MSSAEVVEVTTEVFDELAAAGCRPHRLLVCQHGRLLAACRNTPWQKHQPSLVYSVSKTFTSMAVGIAVDEGHFGYLDRLVDLWPEILPEQLGKVASQIRVRDLLTMSSGHSPEQTEQLLARNHPPAESSVADFLATEPLSRPGTDFAYNNLASWILGRLVARHTGRTVVDLVDQHVLAPLEITEYSWQRDLDGQVLGYSGLHIDASDLLKVGQLLLDDGIHHGARLLPAEWIDMHRRTQVRTDGNAGPDWALGYGWQVWTSQHGYRLDGAFGQYVLVLPEQDAVIVSTNNCPAAGPGAIQTVLSTMWQRLVPALDRTAHSDPEPDDADHTLAADDVTEVVRTIPTIDGDFDPVRSVQTMLEGGHLVVAPGQNGWNLTWTFPDDRTLRVRVGHQRWEHTRCALPPQSSTGGAEGLLDVACCGGWTAAGLVIDLAVISSPHTLRLVLGDEPCATWDSEPLGDQTLWSLVRPV